MGFLDVPALLERSQPRGFHLRGLYALGIFLLIVLASAFVSIQGPSAATMVQVLSVLAMIGVMAGLFLRFWRLNLWERSDSVWMTKLRDVLGDREEADPALTEVGKYNAGQKMVFWSMSVLIIVLITSGVVIWDQYFSQFTSVEQKRIAVLVHSIAAIVAICVWIVHVYAAIWVRGTIRAMTRGTVTGGWAWKHHRKWLRELVTGKGGDHKPGATSAR